MFQVPTKNTTDFTHLFLLLLLIHLQVFMLYASSPPVGARAPWSPEGTLSAFYVLHDVGTKCDE